MKTLKELHLYDWFMIAVFFLFCTSVFFAYKYYKLKNYTKDSLTREKYYKQELINNRKFYKSLEELKKKEIADLKSKLNKQPEQQIKFIYKTKYEKVNSTPDSLQSDLTDSILAESRTKPFKRD